MTKKIIMCLLLLLGSFTSKANAADKPIINQASVAVLFLSIIQCSNVVLGKAIENVAFAHNFTSDTLVKILNQNDAIEASIHQLTALGITSVSLLSLLIILFCCTHYNIKL